MSGALPAAPSRPGRDTRRIVANRTPLHNIAGRVDVARRRATPVPRFMPIQGSTRPKRRQRRLATGDIGPTGTLVSLDRLTEAARVASTVDDGSVWHADVAAVDLATARVQWGTMAVPKGVATSPS